MTAGVSTWLVVRSQGLGVGFNPENVEVNAAASENGNVKFTVTPQGSGEGVRRPTSFFFRVKMR